MKTKVLVSCLAVGIAFVCATSLQASKPPSAPGYAEGIYSEYSEAAGQQVRFDLKTTGEGRLTQLEGRSFAQILGEPRQRIETSENRLELRDAKFAETDPRSVDRSELDGGVEGFDVVGFPVEQGRYRTFKVTATIGGKSLKHDAIEMCWDGQGHCVVFDPSVVFIDSIVNNRRQAKAAGWGPRVEAIPAAAATKSEVGIQAVCQLAGHRGYVGWAWVWSAWTQKYKNVYGMTLVTKNLGGQKSGVTCNSSCYPDPHGYSWASSASGTLGYSAACDNDFNYGKTGRTGKWIAETKCTHKFVGSASANVTRNGSGSGVSLAWSVDGGVDSNGGSFLDTCGYY